MKTKCEQLYITKFLDADLGLIPFGHWTNYGYQIVNASFDHKKSISYLDIFIVWRLARLM